MTQSLASSHSKLPGAHHVHLIVEAADKDALASGMKAVGSRLARAVHRVYARSGRVLAGRYHVRALKSPKEVRNALAVGSRAGAVVRKVAALSVSRVSPFVPV